MNLNEAYPVREKTTHLKIPNRNPEFRIQKYFLYPSILY